MSQDVAPVGAARFPRVTTNIALSLSAWEWLKRRALDEAQRNGGKPNASAVIEQLIRDESARST